MPEHQNIEYKESWRDEYLKWICGFANAQGGKIYIGLDDKGTVNGVQEHMKLMDDIPNKAVNHLGLVVDINLHEDEDKPYLEIIVPSSTVPISYRGNYHYRSGSTKQILKGTALQEFLINYPEDLANNALPSRPPKRTRRRIKKIGKTWDDIPVESASAKDIDEDAIQFFIKNKRIAPEAAEEKIMDLLSNLHLVDDKGKLKMRHYCFLVKIRRNILQLPISRSAVSVNLMLT